MYLTENLRLIDATPEGLYDPLVGGIKSVGYPDKRSKLADHHAVIGR
jgi:hypothetical protein